MLRKIIFRLQELVVVNRGLTPDVHGLSVGKQLQYMATLISAGEADLGAVSLSRSTTHRNKQISRIKKSDKIHNKNENLIKNEDRYLVTQWDGKTLKQTTNAGANKCILAVILNPLLADHEILLDVIDISNNSGSTNEPKHLLQSPIKAKVNFSKIVGCIFDTTATSSGLNKGVVVQLQSAFGHSVFQLASASIYRNVFESATESPEKPLFKQFVKNWTAINILTYNAFEVRSRKL